MFVKDSEDCYVGQNRGIMRGVSMLLEEITEVQNPSVVFGDNQGKHFIEKIGKLVCVSITLILINIF